MSTELATLPAALGAGEAIEALRRLHEHLEHLAYVYVVDPEERLVGVVSFRELVFARPGTALEEVMVANPVAVRPETDREEVADLVQRYNLMAVPVVDHAGHLLGMVTIDDVIEEIQEEATEDIATMVGAGKEETIYTPVAHSVRSRLPWTAVNLGTALLVAAVVSHFEPIIGRLTVLAAYMPVVASVGGNSGAQSQAVVIRAMAVGSIPAHWVKRVALRSALVGFSNGIAVGTLSGLIAGLHPPAPHRDGDRPGRPGQPGGGQPGGKRHPHRPGQAGEGPGPGLQHLHDDDHRPGGLRRLPGHRHRPALTGPAQRFARHSS